MNADSEQQFDELFTRNVAFAIAYILCEQLRLAFRESDRKTLEKGMNLWLNLVRQSKVQEILSYADTIESTC